MPRRHISPINPLPGLLHLGPRTRSTYRLISRIVESQGMFSAPSGPGNITARVGPRELEPLLTTLAASLADRELDHCSAVFVPASDMLYPGYLSETKPLRWLVAQVHGHWIWELIKKSRITTHFQPIVSVREPKRIVAYEALMRAVGPRDELIYPERLLGAARESGLLPILDTAAQMAAIRDASAYELDVPIFVNINPRTVTDSLYDPRRVIAAARRSRIPAGRFVFEVTESDSIEDPTAFLRLSRRFRRIGVRVALDDLGAGYASLSMLPKLKPDFVKIDMQLVQGADHDEFKAVVLTKLVEMAHSLGIPTIAEGIETLEEFERVRGAGVAYAQGFLFGRPAAAPRRLDGAPAAQRRAAGVDGILATYLEKVRRQLVEEAEEVVGSSGGIPDLPVPDPADEPLDLFDRIWSEPKERVERCAMILDRNGTVRFQGACEHLGLGYREGELVGRDFLEIVHPADSRALITELERCAGGGRVVRCVVNLRRKAGEWTRVSLSATQGGADGATAAFEVFIEAANARVGVDR